MGKFPVLVAWTMRKKQGLPLSYGDVNLDYVENVLQMMFKKPKVPMQVQYVFRPYNDELVDPHERN